MLPDLKITRIHRPRGYVWDKGGKIEESYETSSFLLYSPFISLHIVSKIKKNPSNQTHHKIFRLIFTPFQRFFLRLQDLD